jgi:hypothetical protein
VTRLTLRANYFWAHALDFDWRDLRRSRKILIVERRYHGFASLWRPHCTVAESSRSVEWLYGERLRIGTLWQDISSSTYPAVVQTPSIGSSQADPDLSRRAMAYVTEANGDVSHY